MKILCFKVSGNTSFLSAVMPTVSYTVRDFVFHLKKIAFVFIYVFFNFSYAKCAQKLSRSQP